MDSVDYTKSLNREQRKFYDQLDQNREAVKKETSRVEEQMANKSEKQKEVHKKQLDANEKIFQDRVETVHTDAKKIIENKAKEFHEKVKQDQTQFSKQKEEQLSGFNDRINNLSDSYRKNAESQDKFHSRARDMDKENFSKKASELARKHEMESNDVYAKSNVDARKQRDKSQISENMNASKQRSQIDSLTHEHQSKRNREANDMRRNLEQIKQNSDDINFHSQKQQRDNFQRLNSEKEKTIRNVEQSYAEGSQRTKQAHADQKENLVKNQKDRVALMERDFSKDRTKYIQEANRKGGEDFMGNYNKEQTDLRHKDQLEQKRQMYSDNLYQTSKKYNEELDKFKEANDIGRRDDAINNAKTAELKEKQFAITSTEQMEKSNKARSEMMDAYIMKDSIKEDAFNRNMTAEKNTSEAKYGNLKNTFATTLNNLSEKNQKEVETMRNAEAKERTQLLQQSRTQTNEIVGQMRKENLTKLNRSSSDYERRLEDAQQKMSEMQRFYEDKISQVRQDTTNAMDRQQYIHKEQRKQDTEFMKNQMAIREDELNKTIDDWRNRYNRDLNSVSFEYERKMKSLTSDYEARLGSMKTDMEKQKGLMSSVMAREIERTKIAYEMEKARMTNQFENTISKLKDANTQKSVAVEEYKKEVDRNMKKS